MKAKAEIINGLNLQTGVIILNADDENIKKVLDVTGYRLRMFNMLKVE
jgi:UDP-N-acetylmuramoyl-tripeptide--D-alanyl-D-alanine ligase